MIESPGKWSDLAARTVSALIMVLLGVGAIWFGGDAFYVLVAVVIGLMVWELVRMLAPLNASLAVQLGGASGFALLLAAYLPTGFVLPLLLAPAFVGLSQLMKHRAAFVTFSILIMLAGFGMISVRDDMGLDWMIWLVLVVVVTDVVGYFAGRIMGGPKFWPRISPKKTWSGTVAGWIGAAIVGAVFSFIKNRRNSAAGGYLCCAVYGEPDGGYRGKCTKALDGGQGQFCSDSGPWRLSGPI